MFVAMSDHKYNPVSVLLWSVSFFLLMQIDTVMSKVVLDAISATHSMRDGDMLVSAGGRFVLGFFTPGASDKCYLGIWYKNIPLRTVVWVANRRMPLVSSSGITLRVSNVSGLYLSDGNGSVVWSANSSSLRTSMLKNPTAELLDSGNLVVRDKFGDDSSESEDFLWQSFDYPCDVQLPGMKLGKNLVTGLDRYLSSWTSGDDPAPGAYVYRLDCKGYPQPVLMKGDVEQYRNGPWNGVGFTGSPNLKPNPIFDYDFVMNAREIHYIYELRDKSVLSHRVLNQYGTIQRLTWSDLAQGWIVYLTMQSDRCDTYALCGDFGGCDITNSPECRCLLGFTPKSPGDWSSWNWSSGCQRKIPLSCDKGDGFIKYTNVKLPDTQYSWYNTVMTLDECKDKCLMNCSCVAYASLDVQAGGSGCLIWNNFIMDLRFYSKNGQDLYVRVNASEIGKAKIQVVIVVSSVIVAAMFLVGGLSFCVWQRKRIRRKGKARTDHRANGCETTESELPLFDIRVIAEATNNFSDDSKLGEGGFGPVYKGVLRGGREIAVKRLSKDSRQGLNEFKNEVISIAKLQHRNLVKLLGCCIEDEERMLVYEYMRNKSLDCFIFDDMKSSSLEWPKRYQIIKGIARGILYLHQDSRLRIVHRDLKASNILLDSELNPKISDFGLARSFEENELEAKTRRVVGTYGYMSPEYAIDGCFSLKSDVFSFGVLVLEIVSGKRNIGFRLPEHHHNLLGHAWRLFQDGLPLELVDPLVQCADTAQMLRSIHVGLLCVQNSPDDRPNMASVIVMLNSNGELPQPKKPGFFFERQLADKYLDSGNSMSYCSNEVTLTMISGR